MDLIRENELGISTGTALEDSVTANFRGETQEIGLYLAMARQAQREGYPEIGEALKRIAWEEAEHAARFAELNGMIVESTRQNIEKMLSGEIGANKGKRESAVKAKEINLDEVHDLFDETSRDEARHARMLQGILNRYLK
jgi:rubrerythrin